MLAKEAGTVGSRVEAVPRLDAYEWGPFPDQALGGMDGQEVYQRNASLALQLSRRFYDAFRQGVNTSQQMPTSTGFIFGHFLVAYMDSRTK